MKKRVLITGCSSGFGRRLVPLFLEAGWEVVATMRRATERQNLFAAEQLQYGDALRLLSLDVTSANERQAVREWLEQDGRLDCLVHNAGQGAFGAAEETSEADVRAIMELNFMSVALLTKELLPLIRSNKAHIISVSSVFGTVGFPLTSLYCASKHALEGYMESLAYELASFGVKVSMVEPGGHRTEFMPNAVWSPVADSPYAALSQGYRAIQHRLMTKKPTSPEGVCRRVLKLAQSRRPSFQNFVGRDAKATQISHAIFSRNFLVRLLSAIYPRVLRKAGSLKP